jgi:hypothetical protein
MACNDVLSLQDLQTAKKHDLFHNEVITGKAGGVAGGVDIDTATNQVTGQTQTTLPRILADLGMQVQTWPASVGGTLTNLAQVFLNDIPTSAGKGNYYAWTGTFPHTVAPGTDPALVVGYVMRSDAGLRKDLESPSGSSKVGFQQAGVGAVPRTSEDKMRERVSVKDFGAVGDGVADDTLAIQSAINSVAAIFGGAVYFPSGTYNISDTLVMDTGVYNIGIALYGDGRNTIINQVGVGKDGIHFSTTQFLQNSFLRDLKIVCANNAGHCVNIVFGCTTCFLDNVDLVPMNPGKACVYGDYTSFGGGVFDTKFRGGSWYCDPASTEAGFRIIANSTIFNENVFENLRCYQAKTKQFFHITTVGTAGIWLVNNSWKNINFEICNGGGFYFDSAKGWNFENISFWDAQGNYTNNLIDMVAGVGLESISNTFINVTRNGDTLAAGVRDLRIVSGQDTVLINCYTPSDHNPSYDFNNKRVTVIGRIFGMLSFDNVSTILPESASSQTILSNNLYADAIHLGGRSTPEHAQIIYGGGFVQINPLDNSSGVLLNNKDSLGALNKAVLTTGAFHPLPDNTTSLGLGAARWTVVYASTGAINTSDERTKQQIKPIDAACLRAWAKVEFCQFKFNDAVETKGDGARWHFGVIAQRVKEAFESEGLDAFDYGLLCFDSWEAADAVLDSEGSEVMPAREAGEIFGVRYEEALALECAYLRSRLAQG